MIKLEFEELVIEDFKSFIGEHVIDLDRKAGLYYVEGKNLFEPRLGSNGSGKSSIWDAVVWCLCGRTAAGLKTPDVMPWDGDGSPFVQLRIKVGGKRHIIQRIAKPSQLLLDKKSVGQDAIVELVRMDFDILTNTILIGQGQDLFFDRAPAQKLALFNDALRLDRWDERSKLAAGEVNKLEVEIAKFTGEAGALERVVEELASMIAAEEKKEASWKREFDATRKYKEARLIKLREQFEDLQKKIDGADLAYDGSVAEVKALESHCDRDGIALRNAQVDLQRTKDRKLALSKAGEALEADLAKLKKSKTCPTCGQKVIPKDLDKHRDEIETALENNEEEFKSFVVTPYQTVVDKLAKGLEDAQSNLRGFRVRAQQHLDSLQRWRPELASLQAELRTLEESGKQSDAEINPHTPIVRSLRKRNDGNREDLENCKADIAQVEKDLVRSRVWVKGMKEIKLHVIDEILTELQLVTDGMLEDFGLVRWRVHYEIERENKTGGVNRGLHVLISSPNSKGRVRWESWSGGENQRLKIVGALALSQVLLNYAGIQPDMEVLDEPAVYFSGEGVGDLCTYLAERARMMGKRIWYVDHMSRQSGAFSGTLSVERDKRGRSRITAGAEKGARA